MMAWVGKRGGGRSSCAALLEAVGIVVAWRDWKLLHSPDEGGWGRFGDEKRRRVPVCDGDGGRGGKERDGHWRRQSNRWVDERSHDRAGWDRSYLLAGGKARVQVQPPQRADVSGRAEAGPRARALAVAATTPRCVRCKAERGPPPPPRVTAGRHNFFP